MLFLSKIVEDKERILMYVIREIYVRLLFNKNKYTFEKAQIGDLVICQTSGIHPWTIGYVQSIINESEMILREIGSQKTCHISNDCFYVVKDLNPVDLLEGDQYKFYFKVRKAFQKLASERVFQNISFQNDEAIISIREKFNPAPPFSVKFKWSSKMTIKKIMDNLIEQGIFTYELKTNSESSFKENYKNN